MKSAIWCSVVALAASVCARTAEAQSRGGFVFERPGNETVSLSAVYGVYRSPNVVRVSGRTFPTAKRGPGSLGRVVTIEVRTDRISSAFQPLSPVTARMMVTVGEAYLQDRVAGRFTFKRLTFSRVWRTTWGGSTYVAHRGSETNIATWTPPVKEHRYEDSIYGLVYGGLVDLTIRDADWVYFEMTILQPPSEWRSSERHLLRVARGSMTPLGIQILPHAEDSAETMLSRILVRQWIEMSHYLREGNLTIVTEGTRWDIY